jgi:maleylacetoacetate isomerase/maleylpyruvate isomerase
MPALPKLYEYWRSSAAYRVRLALRLKGIDYEHVAVSLAPGESEHRSDAYRVLNPQMLVPFFDDGTVATGQSMAILEYLEEAYPELPLLPSDAMSRARVRSFSLSICCDIHPLNNLRVLQYLKGPLAVDDDQFSAWYAHWIHEGFASAEQFAREHSAAGSFVFGDSASLADVCLIPQAYNARRFNVSLDEFPTLLTIIEACNSLPDFQASVPEAQPDATRV